MKQPEFQILDHFTQLAIPNLTLSPNWRLAFTGLEAWRWRSEPRGPPAARRPDTLTIGESPLKLD